VNRQRTPKVFNKKRRKENGVVLDYWSELLLLCFYTIFFA